MPETISVVIETPTTLTVTDAGSLSVTTDGTPTTRIFDGSGGAGLVPDPGSEAGKYLRDDGTWQPAGGGGGGGGDMLQTTYDPQGVSDDAFDMDNMVEAADAKVMTGSERTKLSGIEAGATGDLSATEVRDLYEGNSDRNPFTDAEQTKLGGIETGATADQTGSEIKAAYEGEADTNAFTDAEKTKLSGVEAGAAADQDASEVSNDSGVSGASVADALDTLDAGLAGKAATGHSHSDATTGASGFMSAADKTKLDGVETGAAADQSASEVSFTPAGNIEATDVQAALAELDTEKSATSHTHSVATTGANGFMSSGDKAKVDGIASGANNYSHPAHSGDVTSVGDGATTIANDAVSNAKLADMASARIKGRVTAGSGDPEDLTYAQVASQLIGLYGTALLGDIDLTGSNTSETPTFTSSPAVSEAGVFFTVTPSTGVITVDEDCVLEIELVATLVRTGGAGSGVATVAAHLERDNGSGFVDFGVFSPSQTVNADSGRPVQYCWKVRVPATAGQEFRLVFERLTGTIDCQFPFRDSSFNFTAHRT